MGGVNSLGIYSKLINAIIFVVAAALGPINSNKFQKEKSGTGWGSKDFRPLALWISGKIEVEGKPLNAVKDVVVSPAIVLEYVSIADLRSFAKRPFIILAQRLYVGTLCKARGNNSS